MMGVSADLIRRLARNKGAKIGSVTITLFVILAVFGPYFTPYDPYEVDLRESLTPPSMVHPLGTDMLGRDILTRIVYGARISLTIGLVVVGIALAFGVVLGTVAGYFGGVIDEAVMRIMDIMLSFPPILLAIAIISAIGPGLYNLMVAVGIATIPVFARVARGSVLSVKENTYIDAARASGESSFQIMFQHILPNALAPIVVVATLRISSSILTAASLSFLGLGIQPPTPDWGVMVSDGRGLLRMAPYVATFPGLAIMFAVIGFNLFGEGLNDALNPRLKEKS